MLDTNNTIEVQGARVHNLKNIDVSIKKSLLSDKKNRNVNFSIYLRT
jgi:hypothetical protein